MKDREAGLHIHGFSVVILFEFLPFIADYAVQVKIPKTATEKILANASEKTKLVPGENVWVKADVLMTHDVSGPGVFGVFKKEFGENAKVCAPCLSMEALVEFLQKNKDICIMHLLYYRSTSNAPSKVNTAPLTNGNFRKCIQVWDREKIVLIPDHYIFTEDARANRNVNTLREFSQEQNIKYFYDITDRSDFRVNQDSPFLLT